MYVPKSLVRVSQPENMLVSSEYPGIVLDLATIDLGLEFRVFIF